MNVKYGPQFAHSLKRLPDGILDKLGSAIILLKISPYHSRLHTKQLHGQFADLLSFRITRDWRVIFRFLEKDTVQLQYVAHRKDAYR